MLSSLTRAKLAATIAAAAIGVGGVAAVAVSARHQPAATPDSHSSVAATPTLPAGAAAAGHRTASPTGTPVGPDATGAADFGLCTAWAAHESGHGKALDSVAFTNLATAAGGAEKVSAYCETVTARGKASDHSTGKPTDTPTGKPADAGKPGDPGKPADAGKPAGAGKPVTVPTGQPTDPGRPATLPTPTESHTAGRP